MAKLLYLAPILWTACALDPTGAPAEGETDQALTRITLASFTCDQSGTPCNFDLAPATDRVCVLAGLTGGVAVGPAGTLTAVGPEGGENILTIY